MRFWEFKKIMLETFFSRDFNRNEELENLTYDPWGFGEENDRIEFIEDLDIFIDYYYSNNKEDFFEEEISEAINLLLKKHLKTKRGPAIKGMSFYTIVPKNRMGISEVEVLRLRQFWKKFFEKNRKLFSKVWYVLESGKHKDNPNLHTHALISFKSGGGKNFSRLLKKSWSREYPYDFRIDYNENGNKGIDRVPCNTEQIQVDKIRYMENDQKGSHQNFIDLGIKEILDFEFSTSQ